MRSERTLFISDFNTGRKLVDHRGAPFWHAEAMDEIVDAGRRDLFRLLHPELREYSWFSPGRKNGFRLDHAFGTALVAQEWWRLLTVTQSA